MSKRQAAPSARTVRLLPPRTIAQRRKHRGPRRAGAQRRRAAARGNRDRRRADRACCVLRLRRSSMSSRSRAWPSSPPATNSCPSAPRPAPARFATPARPCWPRWSPQPAATPGSCPSRATPPKPSTPLSPAPRRRSAAHHRRRLRGQIRSRRAGARPRRRALSLHRRPHSARQADWSLASCPAERRQIRSKSPERHEVLLFRACRAIPSPPPSRFCSLPRRCWPRLPAVSISARASPSRAWPKDVKSEARPHALSARRLHFCRPAARGRARSLAGLGRSRRHGPRQLLSGRARRRRSHFDAAPPSAFCFPEETYV